ncbi:unnamed protein product [Paramecium primaurelia]|uniref:Transmembrane protein n=1 Tax=Paramecium primaurelia TaxID=5886 RepID=A0A8S1PJ29_PARPR|nr:unnamed protein product [Paramecium primaurelia]
MTYNIYIGDLNVYNQTTNQEISDQKLLDTTHFEQLQTICKSYKDQCLPNICKQRMIGCIDDEIQVEHTLNSNIWMIWVPVLSKLAILTFCTIFLCRRMFRKEVKEIINQQFNFQLAQYFAMIEDAKYTKQ